MRIVTLSLVIALLHCTNADVAKKEEPVRQPPATANSDPGSITITGVVTREGVECPAVRGDDGKLYTITGPERDKLKPGLRVRITGRIAEMSTCMQGTTISATDVEVMK